MTRARLGIWRCCVGPAGALAMVMTVAAGGWPAVPPTRVDALGDPLPDGAVARLGTGRFRHLGANGVAFAPDGRRLVSWPALHLFDAATGRRLAHLEPAPGPSRAVAYSPDGNLLAAAGFMQDANALPEAPAAPPRGALLIYDAATLRLLRTIRFPESDVRSLAFAPDGAVVLGCGSTVTVWDPYTGALLGRAPLGGVVVQAVAASPDGRTVAIGGQGVTLWDRRAAGLLRRLPSPRRFIETLTFAPDGKTLAGGGYESGVWLWDVAAGTVLRTLPTPADSDLVCGVTFAPGGRTVAAFTSGHTGMLHLWDVASGGRVRQLEVHHSGMGGVTFSADGRRIAAATASGPRVWDLATFREVEANDFAHKDWVFRPVVAAGGLVATCSDDGSVRLWDGNTGRLRVKAKMQHQGLVRGLAVSPDGTRLASSSHDDSVVVWELPSGRQLLRLAGHGRYGGERPLRFTPDGKRLVSFGDDFGPDRDGLLLRVWDLASGRAVVEHKIWPEGIPRPDPKADDLGRARWAEESMIRLGPAVISPDGRRLYMAAAERLREFDVATGKEVRHWPGPGRFVRSLEISPDGRRLLCGIWGVPGSTQVILREIATGQEVWKTELPEDHFQALAFSADGRLVAVGVGGLKPEVRLLDAATGAVRHTITNLGGRPARVAFAPDGNRLVTALDDTTTLVWERRW